MVEIAKILKSYYMWWWEQSNAKDVAKKSKKLPTESIA
jgi:hypothetical protein